MPASDVYNWLRTSFSLPFHLPLNDDVSGFTAGGTQTLHDTEGVLTPTLKNLEGTSAFLPRNVPGPLPGTTAILCPNAGTDIYDELANNYAFVDNGPTIIPESSDFTFGVWVGQEKVPDRQWGNMALAVGFGSTNSNARHLWMDSYYGPDGPKFHQRRNTGGGDHSYVMVPEEDIQAAKTWAFYVCSLRQVSGQPNVLSLYKNGRLLGRGTVEFGAWSSVDLRMWGVSHTSGPGEANCGFDGALWDLWVVQECLSDAEVAYAHDLYLRPISGVGSNNMVNPMTTVTA